MTSFIGNTLAAQLSASGLDVGLPEGQMGNSEVGHMNLGAGRIVYQDLTRINKAIADGELAKNPVLREAFEHARGARLHFLGLVSDGGVHSHYEHLIALAKAAKAAGVNDIMVHAFTDGRDTSPTGGAGFLKTCEAELARDRRADRHCRRDGISRWIAIAVGIGQRKPGTQLSSARENLLERRPRRRCRPRMREGVTDEFMPALDFLAA